MCSIHAKEIPRNECGADIRGRIACPLGGEGPEYLGSRIRASECIVRRVGKWIGLLFQGPSRAFGCVVKRYHLRCRPADTSVYNE